MLRKPTWKRWRRMEREARERSRAPLAVDDDYTGTGDVERFSIKKRVMKSRFGKSLSRLGERRNSEDARKKRSVEQESHSAVDFSSTADTE